jgi:hypothetical protein
MKTLNRLIQGCVIAGFLVSSSGCLIVPEHEHEHEHERDRDRDREVREHDHDRDRHCDEHDERCRDR